MLVETGGVTIYTPGRDNFAAIKQESKRCITEREKLKHQA
jgi:hypothetical protein